MHLLACTQTGERQRRAVADRPTDYPPMRRRAPVCRKGVCICRVLRLGSGLCDEQPSAHIYPYGHTCSGVPSVASARAPCHSCAPWLQQLRVCGMCHRQHQGYLRGYSGAARQWSPSRTENPTIAPHYTHPDTWAPGLTVHTAAVPLTRATALVPGQRACPMTASHTPALRCSRARTTYLHPAGVSAVL